MSLLLQQPFFFLFLFFLFLEGRREKEGKRTPAAGLGGGFSQQRLADGVMARAPEDLDQ